MGIDTRDFQATLQRIQSPGPIDTADLVTLLSARGAQLEALSRAAQAVRMQTLGPAVYLRGLIELSNRCQKNCLYCGIRKANQNVRRYSIDDTHVLSAAITAARVGYGSLAIQAGELQSPAHTARITRLLHKIASLAPAQLGITLSLGEQSPETLRQWKAAGARRYLIRVETTSPTLYQAIHPKDGLHSHQKRIECLRTLRSLGYIVGTGVMIGLPGQSLQMLANDLLWLRDNDIDMVGMGPYIEHPDTPLWTQRNELLPLTERFDLSIAMVATLRLLMPTINIAATTALQAIRPNGRMDAIRAGANVLMPNITPQGHQDDYALYNRKPLTADAPLDTLQVLQDRIAACGCLLMLHAPGDPLHFTQRQENPIAPDP